LWLCSLLALALMVLYVVTGCLVSMSWVVVDSLGRGAAEGGLTTSLVDAWLLDCSVVDFPICG
jgi:hypothetical protein